MSHHSLQQSRAALSLSRSLARSLFIVVTAGVLCNVNFGQGTPATHGQWNGPYANIPPLGHTPGHLETPFSDGGQTGVLHHEEIGHACLIPPQSTSGPPHPYEGKVLVWNRQVFQYATSPTTVQSYPVTRKVWVIDPATTPPGVTEIPVPDGAVPTSIFCYGHTWTPDGKLVLAGADLTATTNSSFLFDPSGPSGTTGIDGQFINGPSSHRARFYPTLTLLPTGRVAMFGGREIPSTNNKWPEVEFFTVTGSTLAVSSIVTPTLADHLWQPIAQTYEFDYYPRMYSMNAPAGSSGDMLFIANDVIGALSPAPKLASYTYRDSDALARIHDNLWSTDPAPSADRRYGSAAMICQLSSAVSDTLLIERVFTLCGSDQLRVATSGYPALNTVDEFTNLQDGTSVQHLPTPSLSPKARIWQNATILPDESIFLSGGSAIDSEYAKLINCTPNNLCGWFATPQKEAEIFYPPNSPVASGGSPQLRGVASASLNRLYHSTTILLPDGRVLSIGGSDSPESESPVASGTESDPWPGNSVEIFSPPYKFQGVGGRILACPTTAAYGSTFTVDVGLTGTTEDLLSEATRVVLLRCGAVTHHHDYDGRLVELRINSSQSTLLSPNNWRLSVLAPSALNLGAAPKGWYMLFVLTPTSRVPIGSKFIKIQ
ncbi:MAG: DUF1929 domain-containing protein [Planctomycetes bacterium]|nr:DUF1929 domain-containing protein [Planctomycetota bacterium]